nr:polysaccharide deacetylase family protein [Clostridia bacterium]
MKCKKTAKRLVCALLAVMLLSVSLPVYAAHDEKAAYSWYVRRAKDGNQPVCEPEMSFIEGYDAVYLDKSADVRGDKVLYLTFDAGYENGNVQKILDTLAAEKVPGAFFVLKNLIERDTELVKRMANEGHMVVNHTLRHRDMTKFTDKALFTEELEGLNKLYKDAIGTDMPKFYRPPEGRFSEQNLKYASELGYTTVFWSFAYADWDNDKQPDPEEAKEKLRRNTHNGAVILLHPTSATNAAILGDMIREWKSQGYRFGTLDELAENCARDKTAEDGDAS